MGAVNNLDAALVSAVEVVGGGLRLEHSRANGDSVTVDTGCATVEDCPITVLLETFTSRKRERERERDLIV